MSRSLNFQSLSTEKSQFLKPGVAEDIATHRPEAPVGRRSQNSAVFHVAAKVDQGRDGKRAIGLSGRHTCRRRLRYTAHRGKGVQPAAGPKHGILFGPEVKAEGFPV